MFKKLYTHIKEFFYSQEFIISTNALLLALLVLFIANPFAIMAGNKAQFTQIPAYDILKNGLYYAVIYFVFLLPIYFALSSTIFSKIKNSLLCLLMAISISIWVNSTFLVGSYGEIDGANELNINPYSILNWTQIGIFIVALSVFMLIRKNLPVLKLIISSVLIIASLSAAFNFTIKALEPLPGEALEQKYFEFSSTNPNLLYIVLDEYQTEYFEHILDENIRERLNGFVWFKDAMSNFPWTKGSLPTMLTGDIYNYDVDIEDFYKNSGKNSLGNIFLKSGADVKYVKGNNCCPPMIESLFPEGALVNFPIYDENQISTYIDLINYSFFRALPDFLKTKIYNNGQWTVKHKNTDTYYKRNNIGKLVSPLHYFVDRDFIAKDIPTTFKYQHSFITHSPIFVGGDCAETGEIPASIEEWEYQDFDGRSGEGECAIDLVLKVIQKLKDIQVFNNTMIVISADHGSWHDPDEFLSYSNLYSRAAPTLLIKPLNSKGSFITSEFPAVLSDLPNTIASHFKFDHQYNGVNLLGNDKPKNRARKHYRLPHGNNTHEQYTINGSLRDINSWSGEDFEFIRSCGEAIKFTSKDQAQNYSSKGLGVVEKYGRWTELETSEIEYTTNENCAAEYITLKLNAFVTSKHPQQDGKVFINGEFVGDILIIEGEDRPKDFTFPLPSSRNNKYSIRFEINNPVQPKSIGLGEDDRLLGFRLIRMELSLGEDE